MSRKEFEMALKINATLNSRFGSAFASAQRELSKMQEELQALHRAQGDISAYQKQQQALEASGSKLELLQQQYDNIQKEIQETGTYSSDLQNKLLAKEKQIDQTRAKMESYERQLSSTEEELRKAGVNTADLSGESARLSREYDSLKGKQGEVARVFHESGQQAEIFGDASVEAVESVQEALAAAGIAAALKGIADAYGEVVTLAADFQETMSTVQALSGASAQEMQELSDLAKELGASTVFTAREAGEAMTYMGMAGWTAQDMMQGMPGVLQLAAASGEDLASVSDIVTDSMTAFGLTAADTAHYADVLAATATNSNTSVGVMGETFKNAAAVAGALGYSVEDVSVALGLMANAGIKGSNAGTALRNVFNGLLEGVTLTGSAFGEVAFSAVQADGTMMDFGRTINTLREYFAQMTEAERVNNAMTIAGQRGYAGLLSVLNATDADYASLAESIHNCTGAAQHMADIKLDNMNGQLTLMNSAWEALQVTVGEQFLPEMEGTYSLLTDVFSEINDFVKANPQVVKAVAAIAAGVGTFSAALAAYVLVSKIAKAAQDALNESMTKNPAVLIASGIAALVVTLGGLAIAAATADDELDELTATSQVQADHLKDLREEYDALAASNGELDEETLRLRNEIEDLQAALDESGMTVRQFLQQFDEDLDAFTSVVKEYKEATDAIEDQRVGTMALVQRLRDLATANEKTAATEQEMQAIISKLNEDLPDLKLTYEDVAESTYDWATAIEKAAQARADAALQEENIQRYADAYLAQTKAAQDLAQAEEELAAQRKKEGFSYNEELGAWVNSSFVNETIAGTKALTDLIQKVEDGNTAFQDAEKTMGDVKAQWEEHSEALQEAEAAAQAVREQQELLNGEMEDAFQQVQELGEAYQEAYQTAYDRISSAFGLFEQVSVETETSVADMIAALESQSAYMATYADNLQKAAEMGLSEGLIAELSDGSVESAAYLQQIVETGGEKIAELNEKFEAVQEGKDQFSATVGEMQEGFSQALEAMQEDLATAIEEMDLNQEAAESGASTVQGFIDAAEAALPKVWDAYSSLAQTALRAMNSAAGTGLSINIPAHARGTDHAAPGLALVGEEGPELVYFNGGEQVVNAQQTAAMMRESAAEYQEVTMLSPLLLETMRRTQPQEMTAAPGVTAAVAQQKGTDSASITVNFSFEGTPTAETVSALREYGNEFAERVLEVLEEHEDDVRRLSYS